MDTEKQFVVMSKKDVEEMIQQAAVAGAQGRKRYNAGGSAPG